MEERMRERLAELRQGKGESAAEQTAAAARSLRLIAAYCGEAAVREEILETAVALAEWLLDSGRSGGAGLKTIREGEVSLTFQEEKETGCLPYLLRLELDRYRRLRW